MFVVVLYAVGIDKSFHQMVKHVTIVSPILEHRRTKQPVELIGACKIRLLHLLEGAKHVHEDIHQMIGENDV